MAKKKTNPHGANQYKVDPRQALFLALYLDPKSPTFSNALQSALKAGYEQYYAEAITSKMPTWLAEKVRDNDLVAKAEENLKEFVEMKHGGDPRWGKIKADISKFVAERLKKEKWSARHELTGPNGESLLAPEKKEKIKKALDDL